MTNIVLDRVSSGAVGAATFQALSADGNFALFSDSEQAGQFQRLVRVNLVTSAVDVVVTPSASGDEGFNGNAAISADGQFVAYVVEHTVQIGNLTIDSSNVYRKDMSTGDVTIVSSSNGLPGNTFSLLSGISADGRFVAFASEADDLVPGDTNNTRDGFIKDFATGDITRVQTDALAMLLSPDAKTIVFQQPIGATGAYFVKDLATNVSTILANGFVTDVSFSQNGRFVVFTNSAGLTADDSNNFTDVYVKDLQTGKITLVSKALDGTIGNADSGHPSISADGQRVAFVSAANNLVAGDVDHKPDVFVKDLATGVVTLVAPAALESTRISADGTKVAFTTPENFILKGDVDNLDDAYVATFLSPTLTVNPISGDNRINAVEALSPVVVSGTSDAIGRLVTVTDDFGGPGGPHTHLAAVQANGTWSTTFSVSGLADGGHTFSASVIDDAGFVQDASRNVLLDRIPPSLTIGTIAGDDVINGAEASSAAVSGTSDAFGRTVTLTIDGTTVGIAFVQGDGTWSTSINATGVADGARDVVAQVSDLAGNPATATHGVTVDITLPALTLDPVTNDNLITSDEVSSALPVSGTSDTIGGTVTVLVDSNPAGTAIVQSDGTWATTIDATGLSQGVHVFVGNEIDSAGNIGSASEAVTVYSQVTRLVSAPEGSDFGITGFHPSISADGRYIAFQENEDSLVPGDNNGTADAVVRDLSTGTFRLASVALNGVQGNDASQAPIISPDGRFVAFDSRADNLVGGDANGEDDVFIKDLQTGEVRLVSVTAGGIQSDDFSHVVAISANDRFVAFISRADNFFPGDNAFTPDLFVKDLQTGALTHVNIGTVNDTEGLTANLSADGRYIAFWSDATDLLPVASANGNIFVTDLQTGTTELVSSAADGTPGDNFSEFLSLSANGRIVAFKSDAQNLVPGVVIPPDASSQIYVKNLDTGEIVIASTSSTGALEELSGSSTPSLSADGRIVAFASTANNLVANDPGDPSDDVFVKNLDTGVTVVVSHGQFGPPNRESGAPALSGDGSVVAFESGATNIVSTHDSDFTPNIYATDLKPPLAHFAPIAGDNLINASEAALPVVIGGTSNNVGATIDLTIDGFATGSATVLADATWSLKIDASGLLGGPHLFAANVHTLSGLQYTNTAAATVDTVAPTVTLDANKVHLATGETATLTFTFSETVTGFDLADVTVVGGSLGALIVDDPHTYHAVFTPDSGASSASIGVGSGAADLAGNANVAASATLGFAIDGYVVGATVFEDANSNGVLDAGEAATTTDASGGFLLSGGSGPIVTTGGVDIGTGLPFAGSLTAPAGASVATPLTTLTAMLIAQSVANPGQKVLTAFALDPSIDLAHLDPIAATIGGDAKAEAVFAAGAVALDTVTLIAATIAGNAAAEFATASHSAFVALADIVVGAVPPVDLTDRGQIGALVSGALALEGKGLGANVIDGLTQIIAATNMAVLSAAQGNDGVAALAEITAVERVAQGAASDALKGLDGNPADLSAAVAAYADHLEVAIAAARSQTGDIDGPDHSTPPVAVNDSYSTAQNTSLVISANGVLSNDIDADGNALTAVKIVGPGHGTVTLNLDGSFVYRPETGYSGADSFSYRANDGSADGNEATVSIAIVAPLTANNAPVAQADSYQINEDATLNVAAPGVLGNDSDADANPLSAILIDGPAHGTLGLNLDGSFAYVPDAQYNGPDSFSYTANDGSAPSALTTVSLTVNAVDDAPVAQAGSASGNEDTQIKGQAVAADIDTPASQLIYSLVGNNGGAQHGTVSISADGSFSYLGAPNYNGPDSFSFKANDGSLDSNLATIGITVNAVNDAPVVTPLTASVSEDGPAFSRDLLTGASDSDQGTLLAIKDLDTSVTTSSGRVLVLGSDYTLSGSTLALTAAGFAKFNGLSALQTDQAVFHFGASDGILATANALTLAVNGANDTPTLASQTANQSPVVGTPFSLVLPGNTFADVDNGDHLTLAAMRGDGTSLPSWLTFNAATATFGGTPGVADIGGFDVKVTATDTGGQMATDSFHFTVAGATANRAPLITSDGGGDTASIVITDDSKYVTTIRATDPDPGSKITYSIAAGADQKLFSIDPKSGVLSFKSEPRDGHEYQVTIAASDGSLRDTQSLKVQVANGPFESGNSGVADTFEFKPNFGLAIVNNFDATSSHHDVLELDHALFRHADVNMSAKALQDLIDSHSFQLGHDTVIITDTHDAIDLRNIELHKLTAGDFHLV